MDSYRQSVERFAKDGATIIGLDRRTRYKSIGPESPRPLEPGYIPIDKPPRLCAVSFYPNASDLSSNEYDAARASFEAWGRSGALEDYERAYMDWIETLPQVPFHRDFNVPIFLELGIEITEFAWLPLVKCPLPARTSVDEDDIFKDRFLLWDQLLLLKPKVILAQGLQAYDVVRAMCEDKFPHRVVLQKIGRIGTKQYHEGEEQRVISDLRSALAAEL